MPRPNFIKKIREYYGLTQEQLAIFLSVSKGYVAMAEIGRRTLPTAALLKLGELQKLQLSSSATNMPPKATSPLQKQATTAAKALQRYAMDCELQELNLQQQLSKMEENYQQGIRSLQMVELWQQQHTADKKEILWLNLIEAKALKQIGRCGEDMQQLLRVKILALSYAQKKAKLTLNKK